MDDSSRLGPAICFAAFDALDRPIWGPPSNIGGPFIL